MRSRLQNLERLPLAFGPQEPRVISQQVFAWACVGEDLDPAPGAEQAVDTADIDKFRQRCRSPLNQTPRGVTRADLKSLPNSPLMAPFKKPQAAAG